MDSLGSLFSSLDLRVVLHEFASGAQPLTMSEAFLVGVDTVVNLPGPFLGVSARLSESSIALGSFNQFLVEDSVLSSVEATITVCVR